MDSATFHEMLIRLEEGDLSDTERELLLAEIATDTTRQQAFLDHFMLGAAIEEHLAHAATSSRQAPTSATSYHQRNWFALLPWAIAIALLLLIVARSFQPSTGSTAHIHTHVADPGVGRLIDGSEVVFTSGFGPRADRFDAGEYRLETGVIHLRLDNGADLVMRSPAVFQLHDAFHMELLSGDLRAIIPPSAEGFTVTAPQIDYQDLGTEFALSVDQRTGTSELHVFDGQVDAKRPDSDTIISSITEGQSIQFSDGAPADIGAPDPQRYPTADQIGYLRWQQQSDRFGHDDPDLIAYYPFTHSEVLNNRAPNPAVSDGQIHGARWVTGRWPGKKALLFDRDTDYVEIDIPGEYRDISFAAWMKIDHYEHSHSAIFNSNGWQHSDIHWQIHRSGSMRIGGHGLSPGQLPRFERAVPTNRWIHVAGVISQAEAKTKVYLNGELAGWQPITKSISTHPGLGRIGAWLNDATTDRDPVRSLRGKIDEFAIWKRALSQQEIQDLVETGKPSALWSAEGPR